MSTCNYIAQSILPTDFGTFDLYAFEDLDGKEHLVLLYGDIDSIEDVLCRVHSECLTGDALFSFRCDCGPQLSDAMKLISDNGSGLLLYLRQEGRGIGLGNKIRAYALQDEGHDTVEANQTLGFEADQRDYLICRDILSYFSISSVQLLTNNPDKVKALEDSGITVSKRLPLHSGKNKSNQSYLSTKKDKLGHLD